MRDLKVEARNKSLPPSSLILLALQKARNNKTRAAEILAIWRPRLLRRMESLGIEGEKEDGEPGA